MPLTPITGQHLTEMILADANALRSYVDWLKRRKAIYDVLINETMMGNLGYDSTQMANVEAFMFFLGHFVDVSNGTAVAASDPITGTLIALLGLD